MAEADTRLATYGTLRPGEVNHHQLDGLSGVWRHGRVRGRLVPAGQAELGHRALVLDPEAPEVELSLFESPDLPDHWARLDAFEGPGYRRVAIRVETADGEIEAWIYAAATDGGHADIHSPPPADPRQHRRSRHRG